MSVEGGRAIIVVDPQPDFFEGGALPIAGATRTAQRIAEYLRDRRKDYSLTIVTQDWHLDPGEHWSERPNFESTWPRHCAAGSPGAAIHSSLADQEWDVVVRKGQHAGAYSGFEGTSGDGSTLEEALKAAKVTRVSVVGFATDHCVRATALDARRLGFEVSVIDDLCAGVSDETTRDALNEMTDAGVSIVESGLSPLE